MLNKDAMRIFEFVKSELAIGIPPSVRDICAALNIKSTSTVHNHLNELEAEGLIGRANNKRHTIFISSDPKTDVPILGNVAAGQPITAVQDISGYIAYSGYKGDPSELFALKVKGDSMINIGMLEGDIIIVRSAPTARNGQLVVAMIDGEATVKTFFKEDGHFRLQPENDNMEPMIFDEVTILGIVIANIRRYE